MVTAFSQVSHMKYQTLSKKFFKKNFLYFEMKRYSSIFKLLKNIKNEL
jgi:hypothetical protein